jgi:nicotinamide-nucleotide amidase
VDAVVVAVGSELMAGQIVNSNAALISEALFRVGVEVVAHTAVGDDIARIAGALGEALERADVVVVCGGLGPTHDDVTREGLAAATGRPLERRPELVGALRERFGRLGRSMAQSNLRQADSPSGAFTIENRVGSAPGIFLEHGGRLVYVLPGVPAELTAMLERFVLPDLSSRIGPAALVTRMVRTAGMPESEIAERLAGVIGRLSAPAGPGPAAESGPGPGWSVPRLAILASDGEVRVGLTALGASPEQARASLDGLVEEVRSLLGPAVYGAEGDTLEGVVSEMLRARGLRLAVAESLTGGMLASRLVDVPGAGDVVLAGYVTYSPEAKVRDLGVAPETIERNGVVSGETAMAMAEGARARTGADIALSTTGEAGPLPAEAEVGRVCVGLAWEGGATSWEMTTGGSRKMIRRRTCTWALNHLRLWLLEASAG